MAVKDNAQCNFCNFSPDSLSHIYFECDKIKQLWNSIQNVLNDLLETDNEILEITESLVICGYTGGESLKHTVNFLLLVTKYYIYCSYWTNKRPRFDVFRTKIWYYQDTELDIAISKSKIEQHTNKYNAFKA